jgi:hypothetical protein
VHLLGGQQETTEHLLAVLGVAAARETAQVSPQVFEPAFAQIRRAQPVPPVYRNGEEREYALGLLLGWETWKDEECPPPLRLKVIRQVGRCGHATRGQGD